VELCGGGVEWGGGGDRESHLEEVEDIEVVIVDPAAWGGHRDADVEGIGPTQVLLGLLRPRHIVRAEEGHQLHTTC
jgi:hypothetical protein